MNYPTGKSHSCQFARHEECLGVECWWTQRTCACGSRAGKCPHTQFTACRCECHGGAA